MKKAICISLFIIMFITLTTAQESDSENEYKYRVGVQFNPYPYVVQDFSWESLKSYAYAARFGYSLNKNFLIGPEFSGDVIRLYEYKFVQMEIVTYKAGLYGRYTFQKLNAFKPFAEISLYYKNYTSWIQDNLESPKNYTYNHNLTGYLAIGTSWRLFTDRLSLDVMYKLSNTGFVNSRNHVMTYRINFHF